LVGKPARKRNTYRVWRENLQEREIHTGFGGKTCKKEKYTQGLVGKPVTKRPLRRTRRRLQDIKMDLKSNMTGGGGVNWINLAQDR
jgi:hypothetical protein